MSLGNEIQINDGTYNQRWVIAGFDCEKDRVAADGTNYSNGYGIFLIPKTQICTHAWNQDRNITGAYINSDINKFINGTSSDNLKNVLGRYLIERNVLLSDNTDGSYSSSYIWGNAYCTLMSIGQMTGTFASYTNKFDDGEANYKLPVFNYMDKKTGSIFWTRGISGKVDAWYINENGSSVVDSYTSNILGVRPLIMISEETRYPNPNNRYDESHTLIATLNNPTDTSNFCSKYNHDNGYIADDGTELKLGQEIQINNDGYNQRWIIAGFDCEKDHMASDGTVKDNGYGIFLMPKTQLINEQWNTGNTTAGGYIASKMHTVVLPNIANNIKKVLSNNLINRNVLLTNGITGDHANNYEWTTAYCTLMTTGQMTGEFGKNSNRFDDGEANYKLPVFNHMDRVTGASYWLRGICFSASPYGINPDGSASNHARTDYNFGVRPLIMIR